MEDKNRLLICERGYDPHYWTRYPERIENGVDLFRMGVRLESFQDWADAFPSFVDLDWWVTGNEDHRCGWSYHELAEHCVHNENFAERGKPLIPNEAALTNAIKGCLATGRLFGPYVVFANPGKNATIYRHHVLHVFVTDEQRSNVGTVEAWSYMRRRDLVADADYEINGSDEKPVVVSTRSIRQSIAPDLRADVWDKSRGFCWYCGGELHPFRNFHVDHVKPVIDGGGNDLDNLVPCCTSCNSRKGSRPAEYLRKFIGSGVFWGERE